MNLQSVHFQRGDCPEIEAFLAERIYEFNAHATGCHDAESFAATRRDEEGNLIAGVSGYTWGGCCFIANLWVHADWREKGLGASLLALAEAMACQKGCVISILSSHSFQAPAFYEKQGYKVVAAIPDYPPGHTDLVLSKALGAHDAQPTPKRVLLQRAGM